MERDFSQKPAKARGHGSSKFALGLVVLPPLLIATVNFVGDRGQQNEGAVDSGTQSALRAPETAVKSILGAIERSRPLDHQRAYQNYVETQLWMMRSDDPDLASVPGSISHAVWSSDERNKQKFAQTELVAISQNGEINLRVVLNMRNFDKEMNGQEIVDAAIELYQARQLYVASIAQKARIQRDPQFFQRLSDISHRSLPKSLKNRA